jgi:hypothetical protein
MANYPQPQPPSQPEPKSKRRRWLLIGGAIVAFLIWLGSCSAILGAITGSDEVAQPAPSTAAPPPEPTPASTTQPASSESEEPSPPATEESTEAAPWRPSMDVDWENYSPNVKRRVDRMGKREDCDGLQHEFDVAEANDVAQRNRTGDGNADLMGYIDEWMQHAECYR